MPTKKEEKKHSETSDVHLSSSSQVHIGIATDAVKSVYSDIVFIDLTPLGITLNFGQQLPGAKRVEVVQRVSLSPQHLKMFTRALAENIKKYEGKYGKIEITEDMIKDSQPTKGTLNDS